MRARAKVLIRLAIPGPPRDWPNCRSAPAHGLIAGPLQTDDKKKAAGGGTTTPVAKKKATARKKDSANSKVWGYGRMECSKIR